MRSEVSQYLEKGYLSRRSLAAMYFFTETTEKKFAGFLFQKLKPEPVNSFSAELNIGIYQGGNATVKRIRDFLESHSHPAITGAFIHGSIGSDDAIPYSDFDGILLIDEQRIENTMTLHSLIRIIRKTNAMMTEQDALQHHGWNILTVSELAEYPDDVLPLVLLTNSKVIYPSRDLKVRYHLDKKNLDYTKPLEQLLKSIEKKIEKNTPSLSFRHFKSYISEILLLPAVFIQAKTAEPIYKKESFEKIRDYLPSETVSVISKYSALRSTWMQQEASATNEINYNKLKWLGKVANQFATRVPQRFHVWLTKEKTTEVTQLINSIRNQINS